MRAIVFTGPTLSPAEARDLVDATCLGPAAQGDVYRAALSGPDCIMLIDGSFERVPSVWHKEILWAMARGIRVYGAASMGALRAAELAAFGMHGVGAVFAAYLRGALEDDDEVAVAHEGPEQGYRATSEAMVNIRWTLRKATSTGVIAAPTAQILTALAKRLFYPERAYPAIIAAARDEGVAAGDLDALGAWLVDGRVDRKRRDALALLELLGGGHLPDTPARVAWSMEWTLYWQSLVDEVAVVGADQLGVDGLTPALVLDEQRLEPRTHLRPSLEGARVRAREKQRTLEAYGMANPGLEEAGDTSESLLSWWFGSVGLDVPADADAYARLAGFDDERSMLEAIVRERCYRRIIESLSAEGEPAGGSAAGGHAGLSVL